MLSIDIYGFHPTPTALLESSRETLNSTKTFQTLNSKKIEDTAPCNPGDKTYTAVSCNSKSSSRKRQREGPGKDGSLSEEDWRKRLCTGAAVEVRWGKDWWNAHVLEVS